jgi:hypothetical protein
LIDLSAYKKKKALPLGGLSFSALVAVLVALVVIVLVILVILVLIILVILVLIVLVILVILVVHDRSSEFFFCGFSRFVRLPGNSGFILIFEHNARN